MGVDWLYSKRTWAIAAAASNRRCDDAVLSYAVLFTLLNGVRIRTEPLPSHWLGYGLHLLCNRAVIPCPGLLRDVNATVYFLPSYSVLRHPLHITHTLSLIVAWLTQICGRSCKVTMNRVRFRIKRQWIFWRHFLGMYQIISRNNIQN